MKQKVKTTVPSASLRKYEPIRMEVVDVTPQGVLCASAAGSGGSGINAMSRISSAGSFTE